MTGKKPSMQKRPDWWPENPYPADVFPMTLQVYADMVDEETRTAISGCLGRFFWEIASEQIFSAMRGAGVATGHEEE